MPKKVLIFIGILVGVLLILGAMGALYFKPDDKRILNFIAENPNRCAIKLIRNDSVLVSHNADEMMPLASTVKIIIAIEYACQAAEGSVDPDEPVKIKDLEHYYIPNTDGGAHSKWLKESEDQIEDGAIPLKEVVQGMISYSSNANTEWLSERLGLEKINARIDSLGIERHSSIYYLASSVLIGNEFFPELSGDELADAIRTMPEKDYIEATRTIHVKLKEDKNFRDQYKTLGLKAQKAWSERLPASTANEYCSLMQKMNSKTYFDSSTQEYLFEIMDYLLENPKNRSWLAHTGMKGGSTASVLTKAFYATDMKGNTSEMAYFTHDLSVTEFMRLMVSANDFDLNIMRDPEFRKTLAEQIKNKN